MHTGIYVECPRIVLRSTTESWAWTNLGFEVCSTGRVPDRGVAVSIRRTQPVVLSSPPILSALFSSSGAGIYMWSRLVDYARGCRKGRNSHPLRHGSCSRIPLRLRPAKCYERVLLCGGRRLPLRVRSCLSASALSVPTSFFLPANTSNLTCLFLPSLRVSSRAHIIVSCSY